MKEVLPGANEIIGAQGKTLESTVKEMREYSKELEKLNIAEAKRKALVAKQEALTNAQAALYGAKGEILVNEGQANEARENLINFIQQNGDKTYTGKGASREQLEYVAYATLQNMEQGSEAYKDSKTSIEAWSSILGQSETEIDKLKASLPELERQVQFAQTSYLTSSAAIDELTGAASTAAMALQAIRTPSVTYNSGQYANWYYGSQNKHAKGAWSIPYDNYPALLHRGERVLTASQARQDSGAVMPDYSKMNDIIESSIERGLEKAKIELLLDGRAITQRVSRDIANELKAMRFRG